ncbi:hypothetical protein HETIRDRAFT_50142 [Heterobasidion irregulare TC 32-1]|uniref:DNA-(apurinic or apyrimidinic site) endonuclease n=1 Tax=Heterobasidion irregulare (strain TC 32-1) TaxID=747525 RepID=W4K037_HETIT|nr:uncharacterized protein HETIRDRAFT_50142 [Heterobasidion irregulare TC 32-1]ETW79157.1 hypothetical protein HETIRDRAFT_50142 [Heterobasidion irregulare TC 32-1]
MRILTWNLNGVRTIPQYHPWNVHKSWNGILQELGADILCFQGARVHRDSDTLTTEMKTTRAAIGRDVALPELFDSFFSFPYSKGGYSGVAVYTKMDAVVPLKAEEGLSGKLQPKPALSPEERVSPSYPYAHEIDMMPDAEGNTPSDLSSLDSEGRALVVDLGLFVLINLYCPNETSDARLPFKVNYHLLLQERVRKLIEEGRDVIVLGDINVCAAPIDHCDGHLPSNASTFWDHPAREWFHKWLHPNGPMIDVVRDFWPDRKGMYTCWNTKISARETNYGTRIDYILVTPGLLPWIKHSDIQPAVKGSDHCPVYVDLHDEITLASGDKLTLQDAMRMDGSKRDPPRIAAKYWEEFLGRQTLLSSFFGKRDHSKATTQVAGSPQTPPSETLARSSTQPLPTAAFDALGSYQTEPSAATTLIDAYPSQTTGIPTTSQATISPDGSEAPSTLTVEEAPAGAAKSKKPNRGQSKLSSFFAKPPPTAKAPKPPEIVEIPDDDDNDGPMDADYRLACELSASQESALARSEAVASASGSQGSTKDPSESREAWASLFAPVAPPKCAAHGEPAKELRVNKPGPNKGKTFYTCSR